MQIIEHRFYRKCWRKQNVISFIFAYQNWDNEQNSDFSHMHSNWLKQVVYNADCIDKRWLNIGFITTRSNCENKVQEKIKFVKVQRQL